MVFEDEKENSFCGCNGYDGEESYTGFPLKKGSNSEAVRQLQIAISKNPLLPASMRIGKPTTYWGDKTQQAMDYLKLPSVINDERQLNNIIASNLGIQAASSNIVSSIFGGLKNTSSNTDTQGESRTTSTWKDALRNPNKAMGLFGNIKNLFSRQQPQQQQFGQQFGQDFQFQAGLNNGNLNINGATQQRRNPLPTGAWVGIGLVALLLLIFVFMKMAK
jgi:hypothetical protein